jgi:hypothetical protein
LRKIYFEATIIGNSHSVDDVKVAGHFLPSFLSAIIQKFLAYQSHATENALAQGQAPLSGRASSTISADRIGPATLPNEFMDDKAFENFKATGYLVQQFLDFIYTNFDSIDYRLVREFLNLPKKDFEEPIDCDCDCDDHKKKATQPKDDGARTFWRTWEKIVHCAKKLKLGRNPPLILQQLSRFSYTLHCQRIILS